MQKDQAYHEAAIKYNEGLAEFAETLAPTLGHEEIRRWCTAVGNQHRFHAKRHQSALNKILAKQAPEQVEQVADGLDVPEPAVEMEEADPGDVVFDPHAQHIESVTFSDGCVATHKPLEESCDFYPKGDDNA